MNNPILHKHFINGATIEINGEQYTFYNNIYEHKDIFKSFNHMANTTFGISFEQVGGDYEPHVLTIDSKVCANVSVNQIPFLYEGKERLYIQLGTVLTDPEYRGKGLSRVLMESILEYWKDKADAIYLFANDSVVQFYPKFGFESQIEYEYEWKAIRRNPISITKLDMSKAESIHIANEAYVHANPYSKLSMVKNVTLFDFYVQRIFKDFIYYIEEYESLVIGEYDGTTFLCYDIFGKQKATLEEILAAMCKTNTERVHLCFTPKDITNFHCKVREEEDTTLFIHKSGEDIFENDKLMFPVISHA